VIKELFFGIGVYVAKKGSYATLQTGKIWKR